MIGIVGGFWLAALLGTAVCGWSAGIILFCIGCIAGVPKLLQEREAAKAAESWRKNYPPYKY